MPFNDSDLLKGIFPVLNENNIKSDIDYDKIISEYTNHESKSPELDPGEKYREELKAFAEKLNIPFESPMLDLEESKASHIGSSRSSARKSPREGHYASPNRSDKSDESAVESRNNSPNARISSIMRGEESPTDANADSPSENKDPFKNFNYNSVSLKERSSELSNKTDEERRHHQVRSVMKDMGAVDSNLINLENARKEDEKAIMLEEIDFLWSTLEEEDAPGLDKIERPDENDSYEKIEGVLRRLRLKNDRQRYTTFADEFLLLGAASLEDIFDGKKTYLGKRPDLTGWKKEVQVKLRRMKHDTSTLVSYVMNEYNVGPGMRILLELIPNAFIYAGRKKSNYGKPNVFNANSDISEAISNIRDFEV